MNTIPQAIDAEDYIIGACLMSTATAERASSLLTSEMFFKESNGVMFGALSEMVNAGSPTEPVLVEAYLSERGLLEAVGGKPGVYKYLSPDVVTASIWHYAALVKDAWKRRLVLKALKKIESELDTVSADDAVAALDKAALELEEATGDRHETVVDIKDLVAAKRNAMSEPQIARPGVPTPFSFLPDLIGGRLYVLAGYMGDGKTSAALQFTSTAAETTTRVGVASAEMSKTDLFDRWACQRTGLDYWKVRNPYLLDEQERKILDSALSVMEPWDVDVIDDEALDPSKLRRYQRAGRYELLLVDHLHWMRWKDRHDLENHIRSITNVAREFDIPVILLAQLSRAGDHSNPFPTPSMRQLRETAMLEALASCVWFVYRERDEHHVQTHHAQFIVAKNRYGKVTTEPLVFDDASQTFQEQGWKPVEQKPEGLVAF